MAQSISLWGATYSDVPGVLLPKSTSGTALFADPSITTAVAADVAQGKQFLLADGSIGTGTASGGGGSSWTKVCEKSYTRSTTSTSTKTIETWQTNHTEIWTSDKILYVRVRDTAGKRNNYYYGTDAFFYNVIPKNGESTSSISTFIRFVIKVSSSGTFQTSAGSSSVYGICPMTVYKDGRIQIQERYNSNTSGTINGTYKVEVYLLDPPFPIFG